MNCIFCDIVARRARASIVHEDGAVLGFMDLCQSPRGHALVIPKRHIRDLFTLEEPGLLRALRRVSCAVRDAFKPDGVNVWQSNGAAAGQDVFHAHFHVLPRWRGDGMMQVYAAAPVAPSRRDLDAQAAKIRRAMPAERPVEQIRPVAIAVIQDRGRLLVFKGKDGRRTYYRPLGGGIEPGERAAETVQRELKEEIGATVRVGTRLGVLENLFRLKGRARHEIVTVFEAELRDRWFATQRVLPAREADGEPMEVRWVPMENFRSGRAWLVPEGLLPLIP